jgi:hypothetical protein
VRGADTCTEHRLIGLISAAQRRVNSREVINVVEDDSTNSNQQGSDVRQEAPGGRSSRGPEYGTPGEPQVPTPPYDELRGENSGEGAEGVRKAFDADHARPPGPAPAVSEEERSGMSATEMNPEPPLGVGESHGKGGEELAPDRPDVDRKGESQRPAGRAAEDDLGEVGGGTATDPRSPNLQAGDQGG